MVFTNAQTTAFFENNPQMGLTPVQRQRLVSEGLTTVSNFQYFKVCRNGEIFVQYIAGK